MRQLLWPEPLQPGELMLPPALRHRLHKVLRLRDGATLLVSDGAGAEAEAVVSGATLRCGPLRQRPLPTPRLRLAVGTLKGDKLDWLVEKAVELGADVVAVLHLDHDVVRRDDARAARRVARLQELADAAFEQCGRSHRARVVGPIALDALIADTEPIVVGDERGGVDVAHALAQVASTAAPALTLLVGAEGGLSAAEWRRLQGRSLSCSLGPRVLRAETAALALLVRAEAALRPR